MTAERVRELEKRIAELRARWPAHSAPAAMWQELEALEDELTREKGAAKRPGA